MDYNGTNQRRRKFKQIILIMKQKSRKSVLDSHAFNNLEEKTIMTNITEEQEVVRHGDVVQWKKDNPINWENHQIQKDLKFYNKVYLQWTSDSKPYECYLIGRGDETMWGDKAKIFFFKKSGHFVKGVRTLHMHDIGLGKTPKEARTNFMKYNWINRKKTTLHNHIFWQWKNKKNN
jgi:hypothetical protein